MDDHSSHIYNSWILDRSNQRIPQNTRLLLSELYWDYVDISKVKEVSNDIRLNGKRNRWEYDSEGELQLRADDRLCHNFSVHGRRVFAPGNPNGVSRAFVTDQ